MDLEEQYAIGLGVLSVVVLIAGVGVGAYLRTAPPRIVRIVFPLAAVVTLAAFAAFAFIARVNVKG